MKFIIEVADEVSVVPLTKVFAKHGYLLKQKTSELAELTESPTRTAEIAAAHRAREQRRIDMGIAP